MDIQETSKFSKLSIANWTTRPQSAILIIPLNSEDTSLSVSVSSTTISIQYVSGDTVTENITYVGKSIKRVTEEINATTLPVTSKPLSKNIVLQESELISTGGYKLIPSQFNLHDRAEKKGIIIRSNTFSIKHRNSTKIATLSPYLEVASLPWYPRIRNGSFQQRYNNKIYYFSVPEYFNQEWSLTYGFPFKDVKGGTPIVLSRNTLQIPRTPVYRNSITLFVGDTPLSNSLIEDIDIYNGIIYLKSNQFFSPEDISINYTYLERTFEYKGININGHFNQNPFLIDKFVVIYCIPTEGALSIPSKQSIFHSVGENIEDAIDKIKFNPNIPIAILGAYNIQQVASSEQANILDTRVKGGGLVSLEGPESAGFDLENIDIGLSDFTLKSEEYVDSRRFWDKDSSWDGEPYPGAAAVVMEIPEEYRGVMPLSDIKQRASKALAAGVYPIFEFNSEEYTSPLSANTNGFINGYFRDSISGAGWISDNYSIPGNSVLTFFTSFSGYYPEVNKEKNDNYITVNSSTGFYQSYIKSRPYTKITWEERSLEYIPGSENDYNYSDWETKVAYDKREVPSGEFVKGYITLKSDGKTKQFKNIKVDSPFIKEQLTGFKSDLESGITRIYSGYLTQTYSDSEGEFPLLSNQYSNVILENTEALFPYIGLTEGQRYVGLLKNTNLSGIYSQYNDLLNTYISSNFTGNLPKAYFPTLNATFETDTIFSSRFVSADLKPILDQYADYVYSYKNTTSYTGYANNLTGMLGKLMYSGSYLASNYYVDTDSDSILPALPKLGEEFGFSRQEILPEFNQDHLLSKILPTVVKSAKALSYLDNNPITGSLSGVYAGLSGYTEALWNRFKISLTGNITYSGFTISQSEYTYFDRFSEYAGNYLKDLCDTYDEMYTLVQETNTLSGSNTLEFFYNGAGALNKIFNYINSGLSLIEDPVSKALLRGGVIDPLYSKTLYAYGWYCNNAQEYAKQYYTGFTGEVSRYSDLYNKGIKKLCAYAIDEFGYCHETTYVDQKPGKFLSEVPTLIFEALLPGIILNSGEYLPYAYGLYKNITNKYEALPGVYYVDSTFSAPLGGKEYELVGPLSKIYRLL